MDERDINKVADAFDRLLAYVARNGDKVAVSDIAAAKGDILDILSGDWHDDEDDQEDEDESGYCDTVAEGLERWQR